MRIAIATVQVPFIRGGAEILADGLSSAFRSHGHQVELIMKPFRFAPAREVKRSMDSWGCEDFSRFDIGSIDKVICLKFPSYYLKHPNKVAWLLHQHRGVYELFDTPFGESSQNSENIELKNQIIEMDNLHLSEFSSIYTIANRVSERLSKFNKIYSKSLYHPPANAKKFYCNEQLPYIYFPSRLETLKRQELLIKAMVFVKSPVVAIIAGDGGIKLHLEQLINDLDLNEKVRLIGRVSNEEMLVWYANSLGVFFGPYEEDDGYITLEAMLSSKPVITCKDSGGPLEFVIDNSTGYVVEPDEKDIANAIDQLYAQPIKTKKMGREGRARYSDMNISWDNVIDNLLA